VATQLEHEGIAATAIHGNKSQPQRVRALADFKAGRFTVLVATEVASRGLDIDALPHVVNFELPMVPEDYVHRIGRTGRAGVDGDAVSLVCVDEIKLLRDIERVLGHAIPSETIEGFEPDPRIRPEPILRGGLGGARPLGPRTACLGTVPRDPSTEGRWRPDEARDETEPHARVATGRPVGAPWRPANATGPDGQQRHGVPGGQPRAGVPGGLRRPDGPAGQGRPGQSIGNRPGQRSPGGHAGHGPRAAQRPMGDKRSNRPRPEWTRAPQRQPGRGDALPGERLARNEGRQLASAPAHACLVVG
jgi:ATP-dependent RNA helicase RhlE